jgi:hypothetical protein
VFHCALSQQRGPGAALRYLRERDRIIPAVTTSDDQAAPAANGPLQKHLPAQKVYVLDRGFVGWQELFGEDERLTEGYRKELWQDGY